MVFQIFKETIAKNKFERDIYMVHSLCNIPYVCDNLTWLQKKSAMPNTTARTFPSPNGISFSYHLESPKSHKMVLFLEQ